MNTEEILKIYKTESSVPSSTSCIIIITSYALK